MWPGVATLAPPPTMTASQRRALISISAGVTAAATAAWYTSTGLESAAASTKKQKNSDSDNSNPIEINLMDKIANKIYLNPSSRVTQPHHHHQNASDALALADVMERPPGVPSKLRILAIDLPEIRQQAFSNGSCRAAFDRVYADGIAPPKRLGGSSIHDGDHDDHDLSNRKKRNQSPTKNGQQQQEIEQKALVQSLMRCFQQDLPEKVGVEVMEASFAGLNKKNVRRTRQVGDYHYDPGKYSNPKSEKGIVTNDSEQILQQEEYQLMIEQDDELEAPWNQYAWIEELTLRVSQRKNGWCCLFRRPALVFVVLLLWLSTATGVSAAPQTTSDTQQKKDQENGSDKKVAIVTLLTTSSYIPGAMVLAESLKHVQAKGERVLLWVGPDDDPRSDLTDEHLTTLQRYWDKTIQLSKKDGTYTECRISAEQKALIDSNPTLVGLDRYWGTCSKFAVWTLTDYDVIVYMDADSLAMNNFDFCFDYLDKEKDNDQLPDYSFAAHPVPECYADPPQCDNFYTAFMVIKPLAHVARYFSKIASENYLAEGEITLLNQVIQHWKKLPRYTLVAQTETVRPTNPSTGRIDWNKTDELVKAYDFAGKPDTKPWVSHALSKRHNDPNWHAFFGSMNPVTEAYQRYMIPQLLWNQYYDAILEKEEQIKNSPHQEL